jgi:hypothetical protein
VFLHPPHSAMSSSASGGHLSNEGVESLPPLAEPLDRSRQVTRVIVRTGVVDVPDVASISEQRRLARLDAAAAHTFWHIRRYVVGELVALPDGEARRLSALGIVQKI